MPRPKATTAKRPEILVVSVDTLRPHPQNARLHSAMQVEEIAASIMEFGFTNPVLVDDNGTILAGHGRCEAAKLLRERGEVGRLAATGEVLPAGAVPTVRVTGLSEAQRRAMMLADNKIALNATWDIDLLEAELRDLNERGFDISVTGFDEADLARALRGGGEPEGDPESVPEPPADPLTRVGDVWICGDHRIRCGDSTNADDVAALLDGAEPAIMVTDPPYGVEYDPNWRNRQDRHNGKPIGDRAVGAVENDHRADWTEAWRLFHGAVAYVWSASLAAPEVAVSLDAVGFSRRSLIIWAKNTIAISRGH